MHFCFTLGPKTIMPLLYLQRNHTSNNARQHTSRTHNAKSLVQRWCAQRVNNITVCLRQYAGILQIHIQITHQQLKRRLESERSSSERAPGGPSAAKVTAASISILCASSWSMEIVASPLSLSYFIAAYCGGGLSTSNCVLLKLN